MLLRSLYTPFRKNNCYGVASLFNRIASPSKDPFKLAASPENFEEHSDLLKDFQAITLGGLESTFWVKNQISPNTVHITFDDSYRDANHLKQWTKTIENNGYE